ncbi:tetratricopeptide repeat protein [Streptomyces sp. NBC_01361]|uniref:tetratricopeptide repeat protein n=1 Tax=Streptomyces sp. NBC_01361 TaxID=2903838 RepID=UPI002E2F3D49|nr:hypothetical protein [Streptomyces sp. NBC_01361]
MKQFNLRGIATIRAEQYRRLSPAEGDDRFLDDISRHNALGSRVLHQLQTVVMSRIWNEAERDRARKTGDSRVADAVAHSSLFGIAEYLAAGPRLYSEWTLAGGPSGNPRGAALVAAAVDLARAGITSEIPLDILMELQEVYLGALGGDLLRPESPREALEWATLRRYGVTSLLLPIKAGTHYRVFDYLPDALARSSDAPKIPDETWRAALKHAQQASLSFHVGMAAVQHKKWAVAEKAWADDIDRHPIQARINLGRVYVKLKKSQEAKAIWQEAVDLGSIEASIFLGSEYEKEGRIQRAISLFRIGAEKDDAHATYHLAYALPDDEESTQWWLKIAQSDSTDRRGGAAYNLGNAYKRLGNKESSSYWWRKAAERGNHSSMNNLGIEMRDSGNQAEAAKWFEMAAEKGNVKAVTNLADLAKRRGDTDTAIELFERSIDLGEITAYNTLAFVYLDLNEEEKAEKYWREGYERKNCCCAHNIGIRAQRMGDTAGAKAALLMAAEGGHAAASLQLANLFAEDGDVDEAELHFGTALKVASAADICDFGRRLARRKEYGRALKWLNLALLRGHDHAGCTAGQLLIGFGFFEDGERLLRVALADGHTHAGEFLTYWLVQTGRGAAAARVLRGTLGVPGQRKIGAKKPASRKRKRGRR